MTKPSPESLVGTGELPSDPQAKLNDFLKGEKPGSIRFHALCDHTALEEVKGRLMGVNDTTHLTYGHLKLISSKAVIEETIRNRMNSGKGDKYKAAYKESEEIVDAYTKQHMSKNHDRNYRLARLNILAYDIKTDIEQWKIAQQNKRRHRAARAVGKFLGFGR